MLIIGHSTPSTSKRFDGIKDRPAACAGCGPVDHYPAMSAGTWWQMTLGSCVARLPEVACKGLSHVLKVCVVNVCLVIGKGGGAGQVLAA